MDVAPAHIDQIREARNGRMVMISADAGGVAADLRRIDPCLKVRFAENGRPPFWAVFWESQDGRERYLVTTAQAHQGSTGLWTGLDQRLVERIQKIDSRNGYDYAAELEKQDELVRRARKAAFAEKIGESGEQAAHALRKDLGTRYCGRAFITHKPDAA